MSGALVPVTGCPVCVLPYRPELEELLAAGMSFARVSLQLGERQPPVPPREELAANAASHLLPAEQRRQRLAPRPLTPADPSGALELGIEALSARLRAGDLTHISTLPALASALARMRHEDRGGHQAELQHAYLIGLETAHQMCAALAPVLGPAGARRLRDAYTAAAGAALEEYRETGSYTVRTPAIALAADDGQPWAEWDQARIQALREEIDDEVIYQRLLARMRADPQRYYPPWSQPG